MMKTFGLLVLGLLLAVTPVMAVAVPEIGITKQCWDFNLQTTRLGILPSEVNNPYGGPDGGPSAMIVDMSGQGLSWGNGAWYGTEFKLIIDIPNSPVANPYKSLWVNMRFLGDVSFMWIADAVSGDHFTLVSGSVSDDQGWKKMSQEWRFEPNPREEIVVIGFKGIGTTPAAIDQICIETWCVPEPATMVMLGLGAIATMRRRK